MIRHVLVGATRISTPQSTPTVGSTRDDTVGRESGRLLRSRCAQRAVSNTEINHFAEDVKWRLTRADMVARMSLDI